MRLQLPKLGQPSSLSALLPSPGCSRRRCQPSVAATPAPAFAHDANSALSCGTRCPTTRALAAADTPAAAVAASPCTACNPARRGFAAVPLMVQRGFMEQRGGEVTRRAQPHEEVPLVIEADSEEAQQAAMQVGWPHHAALACLHAPSNVRDVAFFLASTPQRTAAVAGYNTALLSRCLGLAVKQLILFEYV